MGDTGGAVGGPPSAENVQAATRSLALLNAQADGLRAQLKELREELGKVQREFDADRSEMILLANEKLVLAALNAETIAEAARSNLDSLARHSQRDDLTDTPNRALMLDRMESAIAQAGRRDMSFAVLFVDLDRFKQVNDTWGHAAGDEVLRQAARRLESVVRDTDTVSRHSGDEFLVLLAEMVPNADVGAIASKMLEVLSEPFVVDDQPMQLSASIGISLYPQDGSDAEALVAQADAAMYMAKRRAPGHYAFYQETRQPGTTRVGATLTPELLQGQSRAEDLREVNQRLVLAMLTAHEAAAHSAREQQQQANFLSMVAHELRNPLAPLRNAAELLTRAQGKEDRLMHLRGVILRQVTRMARLIDDLLETSRGGAGKFHLEYSTVDMREMFDTVVEACHPAIDLRHQQLTVVLPEFMPELRGDAVRLAQVFGNLLDNASRYTPEHGSITFEVKIQKSELEIVVSDTGIGITPEALSHIFDLFVQETRAVALRRGGLGIGLSVVRELVRAHGGSVVAHSAGHQQGSVFTVVLPLGRSAAGGAAANGVH